MSILRTGTTSTNGVVVTADTTGNLTLVADSGVVDVSQTTGALNLPSGTTAQRPVNLIAGAVRYNSNTTAVEVYSSSAWGALTTGTVNGVFLPNSNTISANFTSVAGTNYMSTGKITQSANVVTIVLGSVWKVI
jgi:hypothetical protein